MENKLNSPEFNDKSTLSMPVASKSNEYALLEFKRNAETDTQEFQKIMFYELLSDGSYKNGTTLEEVLCVAILRLKDLNGRFPCRENSLAITKLEEALMWLNARTADRKKRGVEGKLLA